MGVMLPSEYQQVEYLESTGTQYIDTGIITTDPWSIKVGLSVASVSDLTLVAGSYRIANTVYTDRRNYLRINSGGQLNIQINNKATTVVNGAVLQTNQFYAIEGYIQNGPVLVVNGQRYSATGSFASNGIALYLFASHNRDDRNGADIYSNPLVGKIYYAELYVSDELQRKYVPCYRKSDDKPGMYDLVSGTFFVNQYTGEDFTVGSDVIDSISPWLVARRRMLMQSVDPNILTGVEWERGAINGAAHITAVGKTYWDMKTSSTTRIRVKQLVEIDPSKTYIISCNFTDYDIVFQPYDDSGKSILTSTVPNCNTWLPAPTQLSGFANVAVAIRRKDGGEMNVSESINARPKIISI